MKLLIDKYNSYCDARNIVQPDYRVNALCARERNSQFSLYPPALVPFWTDGAGVMTGYWIRHINESKKPTIVNFYGETVFGLKLAVVEYAINMKQLGLRELLDLIVTREGVDQQVIELSKIYNISASEVDEVLQIAEDYGDDHFGLKKLKEFQTNLPLSLVKGEQYLGEFPTESNNIDMKKIKANNLYEIHSGIASGDIDFNLRKRVWDTPESPIWLNSNDQKKNFDMLFEEKDYSACWQCLNSIGWTYADAKIAMGRLAKQNNTNDLYMLLEAWSSQGFPDESRF